MKFRYLTEQIRRSSSHTYTQNHIYTYIYNSDHIHIIEIYLTDPVREIHNKNFKNKNLSLLHIVVSWFLSFTNLLFFKLSERLT